MRRPLIGLYVVLMAGLLLPAECLSQYWNFPPAPPAEQYGNILIDRTSEKNKVKPVGFSHWSHRLRHTCRVCHLELEFEMKLNTTEITEKANLEGKFCGAAGCHDGKAVFGHAKENCDKCHSGDTKYGSENFARLKYFPKTGFGNQVDWTKALQIGLIKPKDNLISRRGTMVFDSTLDLRAEWSGIPPAIFPHKAHVAWLDCSNCHPDLFNIQKKTTKHFSMTQSLEGKFCGVCHLKVAFPLQDCKRCHPTMRQ